MPQANLMTRQKKQTIQPQALSDVIKNKSNINNSCLLKKKKKKPTLMFAAYMAEIIHL